MTILYTWINNTRGNVLLAYLFHPASNTWTQVFSIDQANATIGWILIGLLVLVAAVVVILAGAENLSLMTERMKA